MKFEKVNKELKGIPFIAERNARKLYDFIIENKFSSCLELGFAHGVSSCYIAAALDEIGSGKLTTVDLKEAESIFKPSINELLDRLGLSHVVDVHRMQTGYNWFLHNEIVAQTEGYVCTPKYDFCMIDGPKSWIIDGSAFFLVDKLLKENAWLIFDDYKWTFEMRDKDRDATYGITHRSLSKEERMIPHIQEIFQLLVMQHPNYSNFEVQISGDWAWAQKTKSDEVKLKYTTTKTVQSILVNGLRSLYLKKR